MVESMRRRVAIFVCLAAHATACAKILGVDDVGYGDAAGPADAASVEAASSDQALVDRAPHAPRAWRRVDLGDAGPGPRSSARMAFDVARGQALLYGGFGPAHAQLSEEWAWDGMHWTALVPAASPGVRYGFGLAYDDARKVLVLYGHSRNAPDLWEMLADGTWEKKNIGSTYPAVGWGQGFAYDAKRGVTVLFGGKAPALDGGISSTRMNQTWEWNGTAWTQVQTPTAPSPRSVPAMAYDDARAKTVLFGGQIAGYNPDGETWEYDGAGWTQKQTSTLPSPRYGACMTYDAPRGVVVMFGGSELADTWEYDGVDWKPGPSGPPKRRSCAMTYDPARDQVLMFGGGIDSTVDANHGDPEGDLWVYE